ncbi:MAG: formylmethanofuran dehydrogenase subunit E family protein [Bacillota bacterium]
MEKERILRLVREGRVEHIGARIAVEFDNRQQVPLGFRHAGRHYEVVELIRTEQPSPSQYHYLVRTTHGVYNLVLVRQDAVPGISPSAWWLDFRVSDVPVEAGSVGPGLALVRGELLGAVAFHGHLCPELALGYRAAMIARARLGFGRHEHGAQSVVMYTSSSAADAIQYLTGCTVGKGNLVLQDTGDQVFCFINRKGQLLLKVLPGVLAKTPDLSSLEERIERDEASPQELVSYQTEVDRLVRRILESPDDALFAQVLIDGGQPAAG